jgi:hypothetical protein
MSPRRAVWLVCLVLMAVGSLFAHLAAYHLVAPERAHRDHLLQASGHGYFAHLRLCLALCAAVALLGFAGVVVDRLRGGRARPVPLWVFALVPPLGFVVQEHVERLLYAGTPPYTAAVEATFLLGLALQIPFALVAFFAARALLALAIVIAEGLRTLARPRLLAHDLTPYPALSFAPARTPALARGYSERGPPLPLAG